MKLLEDIITKFVGRISKREGRTGPILFTQTEGSHAPWSVLVVFHEADQKKVAEFYNQHLTEEARAEAERVDFLAQVSGIVGDSREADTTQEENDRGEVPPPADWGDIPKAVKLRPCQSFGGDCNLVFLDGVYIGKVYDGVENAAFYTHDTIQKPIPGSPFSSLPAAIVALTGRRT